MNLITRGMRSSRREISLMEISSDIICSDEGRDCRKNCDSQENQKVYSRKLIGRTNRRSETHSERGRWTDRGQVSQIEDNKVAAVDAV